MSERSWLVPSLFLTFGLGVIALALMPDRSGVIPALGLLPLWLFASAALASVTAFVTMLMRGVRSPIGHIIHTVRTDWRGLAMIGGGIAIAGLNMVAFMWAKPLLNHYVPFRADPLLASFDRLLFLGHDPWTLLGWLNGFGTALFYHRGWFAMMIVTLLVVFCHSASARKSAVLITYFLLWSVIGPVIHILLPAAGPVFYEKLGYGSEFAGIQVPAEMVQMSDYLWRTYNGAGFGPGSGISAMPSMHIATTAWMVIAIYVLARKWTWAMAVPGFVIFLLSVSLGWHYAADGVVGGLAALGCYRLALAYYEGRMKLPFVAAQPSTQVAD